MKPTLQPVLSVRNAHERDQYIQFFEEDHKYIISFEPNVKYTSVTTWNHTHFPKFDADAIIDSMMKGKGWKEGHKYWNMTPQQIKTIWYSNNSGVTTAGTDLHFEIECFMNEKLLPKVYKHEHLYNLYMSQYKGSHESRPLEWQYFINFVNDFPNLKPYRTEWMIYHEDVKISGSVDMIYENDDGTLSIYDWKRAKNITRINNWNKFALPPEICHLPDSNFWHYALQLNTYKVILEDKYGKKVKDLYLVRLHPDAEEKNYELIQLPDLSNEVRELFRKIRK
jgi:CRISPR/Cas system-associated exonuclease Cas4 (RecB family)